MERFLLDKIAILQKLTKRIYADNIAVLISSTGVMLTPEVFFRLCNPDDVTETLTAKRQFPWEYRTYHKGVLFYCICKKQHIKEENL